MPPNELQLIELAKNGGREAAAALLGTYRSKLKRMVTARMDKRLASRLDPSDVVQESLMQAAQAIVDFEPQQDRPFYVWLRQIAVNQLQDHARRHIRAQRRTVTAERPVQLPDESVGILLKLFADKNDSPSQQLERKEHRETVNAALTRLPMAHREILIMRYLEQLRPGEIAAALEISERTVRAKHRDALERMHRLLADKFGSEDR